MRDWQICSPMPLSRNNYADNKAEFFHGNFDWPEIT